MQYSEAAVIQTWSQSRNEIYTHTEHLVKKTQQRPLIKKKLFGWSLTKKKENKETRKKS